MKHQLIASTLLLTLLAGPAWADKPAAAISTVAAATHQGTGKVISIDRDKLKVKLEHGPIASLNWPGMTMDFSVTRAALLDKLQPGTQISFTLVPGDRPGRWVIDQVSVK